MKLVSDLQCTAKNFTHLLSCQNPKGNVGVCSIATSDPIKTLHIYNDKCDGIVVRASALQSVDLGFIPLVESYQKTLKNDIRSFPAWRSAFRGGCGEQASKFACCVLGQGT